jgi:hypothetical protein
MGTGPIAETLRDLEWPALTQPWPWILFVAKAVLQNR